MSIKASSFKKFITYITNNINLSPAKCSRSEQVPSAAFSTVFSVFY